MNQYVKIAAAIVVLLIVLYGGYRIYHHFTWKPPTAAVVVAPTKSPTTAPMENTIYKTMSDPKLGSYLTDEKGMTLYTYSKDTVGVSNCSGKCITNWPAYGPKTMPTNLPANITVITRTDKSLQYAWKGMPLYYFASDVKAGDITGNGVGGFTVVK